MLRRIASCSIALVAACCYLASTAAAHAQHPNVARGFSPSGMFDVGGLDVVNGFNGNLVITIPVGQKYPVGGLMGSYSFSLVYNSNVWSYLSHDNGDNTNSTYAISDPVANAGLGWRFSLGRIALDFGIFGFQAPDNGQNETYFGEDGDEHFLFPKPNDPDWYSKDGSFLRFTPAGRTLELPDGMIHTFDGNGYPTSLLDRFGNGIVNVTYLPMAAPYSDLIGEWDIHDNWGRTHRVVFRPTTYPVGYEQRAVIDHIDVQAFGGGTSTYTFLYNDETASGVGTQEVRMIGHGTLVPGGETQWNPRVFLLTKLQLPDGSSYGMSIAGYQGQNSSPAGYPGPISALRFPTSGSVGWTYSVAQLPEPSTPKLWLKPIWKQVLGVATRSLSDSGGGLIGKWKYSTTFDASGNTPEVVSQMTFPAADPSAPPGTDGHRIVTYYSACVHATCTGTGGAADTHAVEYGLPLSRLQPDDGAGHFLSQQIFEQGGAWPVRSVYVNYDNDGNPNLSDEPIYANQRLQLSRTFFLDDPVSGGSAGCHSTPSLCTSVTDDSSEYDGVGHYRLVTRSENFLFPAVSKRFERTQWNQLQVIPPGPQDPWILNTYTYKRQQEGSAIQQQDAVFDPMKGFLKCSRLLKSGMALGLHDLVMTYGPDNGGNVAVETGFGGDTATVSTATDCPSISDSPVYTYSHAYTSGTRSSTTVQLDPTHSMSLLNLTVDPGTGLPSASTDASGRPTYFTYDAIGRLLTTSPRGDATAAVSYQLSDTAPPFMTAVLGAPSSPLQKETVLLDGLGRVVQDIGTLPGGGGAAVTSSYNALGWKTFVSERSSGAGTSFLNYDAFGRPGRILHPDGKQTQLGYTGVHKLTRTEYVQQRTQQTDFNNHLVWVVSELPAITRETYDGLGRLRQVKDAMGTLTHYTYDVGGRLDAVLSSAGGKIQVRSFQYDGRGFLVREVSPEGGAVSYRYDARGDLTQRSDAAGAVFSVYDGAGRPVHLSAPSPSGAAKLKDLEYDTAANGTGKLAVAHAYNWRSADSCSVPFEVRQELSYDPSHGRLSSEVTTLLHGSALEQWTQGYAYDGDGSVTQTTYPSCLALCPATPRTVTTNYSFGRPTSVPGFASPITYSPNAMVATIAHQNGVVFTQTPEPTGMARPKALGIQGGVQGSANPWQPETYSYDAAGNVTQIGAKSFTYDADSRLVSATLPSAGSQPYQQYSYDAFGNLTLVASGTSFGNTPSSIAYDTDANNHLTGAGYDGTGTLHTFQFSTYLWDPLQQLTDVDTGSEKWVHTYDAMGERVWSWRTSPSRIDNYALRGQDGQVLSLFTKTGSAYTWEDYVYREGQLLAAQFSDGSVQHFDIDHLGSVRVESDGTGHLLHYRDLWPYGDEATPPASSERMRFTGHERDLGVLTSTADDIDYMHARYYRPGYGRFLSLDSLGGSTGEPQSWNRYAYTSGNPLRYVDPDGQGKLEPIIWLVERIPGGGLKLLEKLFSRKEAADLVEKGADVLAKNQKDIAFKVAEEGGGGKAPIWDPAHGGRGYRPHYHLYGRAGGHVFYGVIAAMTLRHWADGHGAALEFLANAGDFINPFALPDEFRVLMQHFAQNAKSNVLTEEDLVLAARGESRLDILS